MVEGAQRSFQAREWAGAQEGSSGAMEDGAVVGSVALSLALSTEVVDGSALGVVLELVEDVMASAVAAAARISRA